MRLMKLASAFVAIFVIQIHCSYAQNEKFGEIPPLELPEDLRAYQDVENVISKLSAVIEVLGTAQFEKASYSEKVDEPPCDAINRGMMLVHAGFNMAINNLEKGLLSPAATLPGWRDAGVVKGFISPRRGLLTRIWDMPKILEILNLGQKLATWPEPLKSDLRMFLGELLNFRQTRKEMFIRDGSISPIQERETIVYSYHYNFDLQIKGIKYGSREEDNFKIYTPKPLTYSEHSYILFEIFKRIPRVDRPENACLKETAGAKINFAKNVGSYDSSDAYTIRYMFTFWERRELEGTSPLRRSSWSKSSKI